MAKSPLELSKNIGSFKFTDEDLRNINRYHKNDSWMNQYELKDVDLDLIANDTNLDNDYSMADRRPQWWGNDINKYNINYEKLRNSYITDPIRVKQSNGKWRISDGHHRIKALRNMGYNKAPVYVLKEENK